MLNQYGTFILSALLGACSLADAGALADTLSSPDIASADGNSLAVALLQLPRKSQEPVIVWDQKKHGERCLYREGACRHFHDVYYYETPWWGLPLAIGGAMGAVDY